MMRKKIGIALATFALVFCMPLTAFAAGAFDDGSPQSAGSSSTQRSAGNLFAIMHPVSNTDIENDLYWAGQMLDASKVNVGTSGHGSILAAGQKVTLKNITVADSVRAAAQEIAIDHAQVGNNLTLAAQTISLGNDVRANGVYVSAQTLSVAGSYQGGGLYGETVNFDGVVEGDLNIEAAQITIGKNAQVKGQLTLPEGVPVEIAEGAQVPNITYVASAEAPQPTLFDDLVAVLYACMAHIVLVGLFFLIIRKSLVRSANMARTQLVKMLLSGLVIFIVAPILCLLLIFPLVTIPVVVLMVLVMVIIALFSLPFTGSALGLMILGKRMNPVLAAIIGTLILTLCAYVPILSLLTVIFCIIFTAGYLWCCYWEMHQERKKERIDAQQSVFAAPTTSPISVDEIPLPPIAPDQGASQGSSEQPQPPQAPQPPQEQDPSQPSEPGHKE